MMGAFLVLASLLTPRVEISVAPDQPIPHVYVGDPLILEMESEEDLDARVTIGVKGTEESIDLGRLTLRARGTTWHPVMGFAMNRGLYDVLVVLESTDARIEKGLRFCRLDRLGDFRPCMLFGVSAETFDTGMDLAMQALPVRRFRAPLTDRASTEPLRQAAESGLDVIVSVEAPLGEAVIAEVERVSRELGERIIRWDVADPRGVLDWVALEQVTQSGGGQVQVSAVVHTPDELGLALGRGAGVIDGATIYGELTMPVPLESYHAIAEHMGYEGLPLSVCTDGSARDGAEVVRRLTLNYAGGAQAQELGHRHVYREGVFCPSYPALAAWLRRLSGLTSVGDLAAGAGTARVFRDAEKWVVVMWADAASTAIALPVGQATAIVLEDAEGNPLETPAIDEQGRVTVNAGPSPRYLSGQGGEVLRQTAIRRARVEATSFLGDGEMAGVLEGRLKPVLGKVSNSAEASIERSDFFGLVRAFVDIEEEWHRGTITRAAGIRACASLARLTRALAILEEARGEAFVEPLQKAVTDSRNYQSLYLTKTGVSSEARERGDWLLKEVGLLVDEALKLDAAGHRIEADAVATIALWRARALDHAAQPVSQKPREATPPVTPPAAPEVAPATAQEPQVEAPAPGEATGSGTEGQAQIEEAPTQESPKEVEASPAVEPEVKTPEEPEVVVKTYKVLRGEYPGLIADKHKVPLDDFLKWNNWRRNRMLHIGDEYVIHVKP